MAHIVGLVGLPNKGKSTFFKAATHKEVGIANYPFTTIEANMGIAFVSADCACRELKVKCNPQNSKCINGIRLIPIELIDVAGLVKGAHEGLGLGNKFLDDLRQASVLIQVVDISGKTNEGGNPAENFNPTEEVAILENEIDEWFFDILKRNWKKICRQIELEKKDPIEFLAENFSGLGITEKNLRSVIEKLSLILQDAETWSDELLRKFAKEMRIISKPIIIAANKMDLPSSAENIKKLRDAYPKKMIIPTSAEVELALRNAADHGLIEYTSGTSQFKIIDESKLNEKQKQALTFSKEILDNYGSTGIQACLNEAVFKLLDYIVVYPVENETHYTDKKGNVLPDAFLVPKGITAREFAFKVHTDIGQTFIYAVDCKTKMRIAADHALKNNDVIKIVSAAK